MPQNLTISNQPLSMQTFDSWLKLIREAKHRISIAAYKSSLRGKHVFGNINQEFSSQGEIIYNALAEAGLKRHIAIRIVENSPSKDIGDNEDAIQLHKIGAITRKALNFKKIYNTGVMHSKFIIVDSKHFYLGSANLDWRSLNQKMELGVYVTNCSCMAKDLTSIFDIYWQAADAKSDAEILNIVKQQQNNIYNNLKPLKLQTNDSNAFLAASPLFLNAPSRSWDLDAIVNAILSSKKYLNIHVMDYIPMFIYEKKKTYWLVIHNAIRSVAMRGVKIKIIAAALHYPNISLEFLKSLESLNKIFGVETIKVKILKVPSDLNLPNVIKRDRRTHKKFLVTDNQVIIGTSNWSGDYFEGKGTGVAIVIKKNDNNNQRENNIIKKMSAIFDRDWNSEYVHSLNKYINSCLQHLNTNNNTKIKIDKSFCEPEKDSSLFVKNNF